VGTVEHYSVRQVQVEVHVETRKLKTNGNLQVGLARLLIDVRRLTEEVRAFRDDVALRVIEGRALCATTRWMLR